LLPGGEGATCSSITTLCHCTHTPKTDGQSSISLRVIFLIFNEHVQLEGSLHGMSESQQVGTAVVQSRSTSLIFYGSLALSSPKISNKVKIQRLPKPTLYKGVGSSPGNIGPSHTVMWQVLTHMHEFIRPWAFDSGNEDPCTKQSEGPNNCSGVAHKGTAIFSPTLLNQRVWDQHIRRHFEVS
jgi:hypothetical protein